MHATDILHMRFRGRRGVIAVHRGLRRMPANADDAVLGIAMSLAGTALWVMSLPTVMHFWARLIVRGAALLEMPPVMVLRTRSWGPLASVAVPHLSHPVIMPTAGIWWITALVSVVLLIGTAFLPPPFLPLRYLARAMLLVQASALAYFALAPAILIARLPDVPAATLDVGLAIISVVPAVLGFTFYVFDVGLGQKILLTVMTMTHLVVLVPLQYLMQLEVLRIGSQLMLPICFVALGPVVDVMVFIAFYSWGASWPGRTPAAATAARPSRDAMPATLPGLSRLTGTFRAIVEARRG